MPPVLGPRSPSQTVLWSCAAPNGSAETPSESTKNDTSSPVMNSSTTTARPASPNAPSSRQRRHGAVGLVEARADDGTLARGEAVGLDHDGRAQLAAVRAGRLRAREDAKGRGGNPVARHQVLREDLRALDPRRGLARPEDGEAGRAQPIREPEGEGQFRSHDDQIGAAPAARARRARRRRRPSRERNRACAAMPGLPGAATRAPRCSLCASFHASACSRPPPPTSRTFTRRPPRTPRSPPDGSGRSAPTGCRGRARDSGASVGPPTRSGRACRARRRD